MTENLRKFPRKVVQIEVELSFLEDTARNVITLDVSNGGLFILLKNTTHYPLGEMVNMRFKNPLGDFEDTTKDGIVVRHTDDGIAVAFIEIDEF